MRDLKKIKSQQSIIGKKYASKKYDQLAFGEFLHQILLQLGNFLKKKLLLFIVKPKRREILQF